MLYQRRRRWADIVQMLCKCFAFAGMAQSFYFHIEVGANGICNSKGREPNNLLSEKSVPYTDVHYRTHAAFSCKAERRDLLTL